MDRKDRTLVRRMPRLLLVAACASFAAASSARAVEPVTAAPATLLADGIWTVQGRAIQGTRRCGDWLVRLTNRQGQISGVVSLARSTVPIRNLALQPDGSFSGTTRAGLTGSRHTRAYQVTGKFSGDTVSLTLEDNMCPPRHGTATRQATGGGSGRAGCDPTGVVEYGWLGGADVMQMLDNSAVDFIAGVERNWSNLAERAYTQWVAGLVFKTG